MRKHVDPDEIEALGQRACRAIDEARLARLRSLGLSIAMVEYCEAGLSPDNVLLLAAPQDGFQHVLVPQAVDNQPHEQANAGVVLELDPTGPPSLQHRLVSYIQEQQARGRFSSLGNVAPFIDSVSARVPALFCALRQAAGEPDSGPLLKELLECQLVSRAVARFLPLDSNATGFAAFADAVATQLATQGDSLTVRVCARPRELEKALMGVLAPSLLSPTRFTHTLCVAALGNQPVSLVASDMENARLRFAILPRASIDPTALAANKQSEESSNRTWWRFFEVATRWPQRLEGTSTAALLVDSQTPLDRQHWIHRWAGVFLPPGAQLLELRLAASRASEGSSSPAPGAATTPPALEARRVLADADPEPVVGLAPGQRASLLLCEANFGSDKEAIDDLARLLAEGVHGPTPCLAAQGHVVLRLRPGRAGRAVKRWHRETARILSERLGARQVELLHLLSDKEPERTALLSWGGAVGASADD